MERTRARRGSTSSSYCRACVTATTEGCVTAILSPRTCCSLIPTMRLCSRYIHEAHAMSCSWFRMQCLCVRFGLVFNTLVCVREASGDRTMQVFQNVMPTQPAFSSVVLRHPWPFCSYSRTLLLPPQSSASSVCFFSPPFLVYSPLLSITRSSLGRFVICLRACFFCAPSFPPCPPPVFLSFFFCRDQIADFGFSALFRELETESSSGEDSSEASSTAGTVRGSRALPPTVAVRARAAGVGAGVAGGGAVAGGTRGSGKKGLGRGVRRLTSVVGSPYYVAPEVRGCCVVLSVLWRVLS